MSLIPYIFVVYGIAAIVLLGIMFTAGTKSNWLLSHDLHLDPFAGTGPAVDRSFHIQLGAALPACGAGLYHHAGRADRLGCAGLLHIE